MTYVPHGLTRFDKLMQHCVHDTMAQSAPLAQTFGRLVPGLKNPLQWSGDKQGLADIFEALIDDMLEVDVSDGPAEAGMTFFGQFIDHDITLDATSAIGTQIDPRFVRNLRTPNLDLDCVYGDGPEASPHLYANTGHHPDLAKSGGFLLFGRDDNPLDLARNAHGTALIGDPRNDENVFVSQIQGAFICLHNILMSHMSEGDTTATDVVACAEAGMPQDIWDDGVVPALKGFEAVRRFIRLHYQWLICNRFLPAFCTDAAIHKGQHPDSFPDEAAIMPVEFSGAAYRFGHATAQTKYAMKTGTDPIGFFAHPGFSRRPLEANMDMNMMFDMRGQTAPRARAVSTKVASALFAMPFIHDGLRFPGVVLTRDQAAKLPLRNIMRDRFALEVASGQQIAAHLGIAPQPVPKALADHGIQKTPLWFHSLQEAEASGEGKLDGAGGAIVAWVLLRLLRLDKTSVLHVPHFEPWHGFGGRDMTVGSLMEFVETHRGAVKHAELLRAG